MKKYLLEEMVRGWFVGDFEPSVFKTNQVEVGIKHYKAGTVEPRHFHMLSTEITVIVSGLVRINSIEYGERSIVVVEPQERTTFESITDSVTAVVKIPGSINDKYLEE